jgi:starch-binding outer membrane protein, SusD/RagB family
MKARFAYLILVIPVFIMLSTCRKDFLVVNSGGSLDQHALANKQGIDALLIGAYSMLDGVSSQFGWEASSSNWVYGSIRGLEANKGTDSGDPGDINAIQNFTENAGNIWSTAYLNVKWKEVYEAISRCNSAVIVIQRALDEGNIDQPQADLFFQQARALRGWYHFEAWRMWKMIPWVDEKTDQIELTNTEDIRPKIIADLTEGSNLPDNMGQVGRFNGTVVKVLLAKALMQMYNNYEEALPLLQEATAGTKPDGSAIGLASTYGEIFDLENRNGIEAVYTVQYSVNDGSGGLNGSYGEVLNYPYKPNGASPGSGCCGFFQPTQEFVNSFKTLGGLPMLDCSYNSVFNLDMRDMGVPGGSVWDSTKTYYKFQGCTVYKPEQPFRDLGYVSLISNNKGNNPLTSPEAWSQKWVEDNSAPVDPRLDWTVGRRGIPYWDWGTHTGSDWIRDQAYAGPYSPKKMVYKKSQEGKYTETGGWTTGFSANGYRMIRFADVLLLIAECQIETGDLPGAMLNINLVRARAANPEGFVMEADGVTPAANYQVGLYTAFTDIDQARKALRMERKLELGMEGHRWFDLNRWGITVEELNRALRYEKHMPWGRNMYGNAVVGPEDVTYPIPQLQIDQSYGRLVQNR